MLNNTVREFLLQVKRGNAALVLDGLYFSGWQAGENFSFDDAYEYLSFYGASRKLVRSGLNDPLFQRVGRRNARYTLPSPESVLSALQLHETPFKDQLTSSAFANLAAYRKELHQAFLGRADRDYSRKLLSQRLGVTRTTTIAYEKLINLEGKFRVQVEPQFSHALITYKNVGTIPLNSRATGGREWLEKHLLPNQEPQKAPLIRHKALEWLAQGHKVYRTKQLTNYYQLIPV